MEKIIFLFEAIIVCEIIDEISQICCCDCVRMLITTFWFHYFPLNIGTLASEMLWSVDRIVSNQIFIGLKKEIQYLMNVRNTHHRRDHFHRPQSCWVCFSACSNSKQLMRFVVALNRPIPSNNILFFTSRIVLCAERIKAFTQIHNLKDIFRHSCSGWYSNFSLHKFIFCLGQRSTSLRIWYNDDCDRTDGKSISHFVFLSRQMTIKKKTKTSTIAK